MNLFIAKSNRKNLFLFVSILSMLFTMCRKEEIDSSKIKALLSEQNVTTEGTKYYVDPSASSSTRDGSISNPWKTIDEVNSYMSHFKPGDCIYFKKGQHFKGSLVIYTSGSSSSPITFASYGSGIKPVFEYDLNINNSVDDRLIIDVANAKYIVLDGFTLTDEGLSKSDHNTNARVGTGIHLGGSSNITIKNMRMSLLGTGVAILGDNNKVDNCSFDNMRMIVNDGNYNNDYGATGMTLNGSNNKISNNTFSNNWATSHDYGYDGGAIEFFGSSSNNKFVYNTCNNNEGFMEIGGNSGDNANNNTINYNLLINNGRIFYINNSGAFGMSVYNLQFYNNNVVETVTQGSGEPYLFSSSATGSSNMLVSKNNIFWISRTVTIAKSTLNTNSFIHQNNIYRMASGNLGFTLNENESSINLLGQLFSNTSSSDPNKWNYSLASLSPAIDFGLNLGFTSDLKGNPVYLGKAPDAGAVETK